MKDMELNNKIKEEINQMSYSQMVKIWRQTHPSGYNAYLITGDIGLYFLKRKEEIKPKNHIEISKNIKWW